MTSTAQIKPINTTAAPESEFERGVREGAHNALAYFRDENGYSTVDEYMADSLDRIEAQSVDETLRDETQSATQLRRAFHDPEASHLRQHDGYAF